jgi:hypothetical protein
MRSILSIAVFGLVGPLIAASAESNANTDCIEQIEIPSYPALASQARITAVVIATVNLRRDGTVDNISSKIESSAAAARDLFRTTVDGVLKTASYAKGCEDKPITLIFNFVLGERLSPAHGSQTASFGYPNRFRIVTPPHVANP